MVAILFSSGCYDSDLALRGLAYDDGVFVAVGQLHPYDTLPGPTAVFTSTDGESWRRWPVGNGGEKVPLVDVARGDDRWIAVGGDSFTAEAREAGYPAFRCIATTSTDGEDWTLDQVWTDHKFTHVAYGNDTFVAAGFGGPLGSSPDGTTWTEEPVGIPEDFSHRGEVTFGGGKFLVPGELDDELRLLVSSDGINWDLEGDVIPEANALYGASFLEDHFVGGAVRNEFCEGWGCGSEDDFYTATSGDGLSWSLTPSEIETRFYTIAHGDGLYVAQWHDGLAVSDDGFGWEVILTPPARTFFGGIAYGSGRFVAVGSDSAWISMDGREWERTIVYEED